MFAKSVIAAMPFVALATAQFGALSTSNVAATFTHYGAGDSTGSVNCKTPDASHYLACGANATNVAGYTAAISENCTFPLSPSTLSTTSSPNLHIHQPTNTPRLWRNRRPRCRPRLRHLLVHHHHQRLHRRRPPRRPAIYHHRHRQQPLPRPGQPRMVRPVRRLHQPARRCHPL